jgi:hypothetical protein
VTGDLQNGHAPAGGTNGNGPVGSGPVPVPELAPIGNVPFTPSEAVTDEDRNRFGILLDRAAERGLLGPAEYEVRLGELAEATTIDQMRTIVTDLPLFTAPSTDSSKRVPAGRSVPSSLTAGTSKQRGTPWVALVVVVIVLIGALAFLAVYAQHLTHTHSSGSSVQMAPLLSGLHL